METPNEPTPERAPRGGVRLMTAVVAAVALVSIYANVQKHRRGKIENVTVQPAPSVALTTTPTPAL